MDHYSHHDTGELLHAESVTGAFIVRPSFIDDRRETHYAHRRIIARA